jgi:hypothetical protein
VTPLIIATHDLAAVAGLADHRDFVTEICHMSQPKAHQIGESIVASTMPHRSGILVSADERDRTA